MQMMQMKMQSDNANDCLVRFPKAAKDIKPHFPVLNCTYVLFKIETSFSKMDQNGDLDPWKGIDFGETSSQVLPTQLKSES